MKRVVCVLLAACAALQHVAAQLHFVDSSTGKFFINAPEAALTQDGLAATLCALLSVTPSTPIDSQLSQQVEAVLVPDLFQRPQAVVALQLAGVSTEEFTSNAAALLSARRQVHPVQLVTPPSEQANAVLRALGALVNLPASPPEHWPLDHTGLPACSDACMEELLQAALAAVGGNYSNSGAPLAGRVSLPPAAGAGPAAVLDLQRMPDRLAAVELATLHHTLQEAAGELRRREAQEPGAAQAPQLLEGLLVGPQALRQAYGAGQPASGALVAALARVLAAGLDGLEAATHGRAAAVVALVGDVRAPAGSATPSNKLAGLLTWREAARRRYLLADIFPRWGKSLTSEQYTTRSTAVLSFIFLLAFLLAGCYCLTYMPFKRDSLLYPRTKSD